MTQGVLDHLHVTPPPVAMDRDAKVWWRLCIVSPLPATAFTQMRLYQFFMLMCSPRLGRKTKTLGGCPEQSLLRGGGTTRKRGIATRLCSHVFADPRAGLLLSSSVQIRRMLTRSFSKSIFETFSAAVLPIRRPTYARNRTKVSDIDGLSLSVFLPVFCFHIGQI